MRLQCRATEVAGRFVVEGSMMENLQVALLHASVF